MYSNFLDLRLKIWVNRLSLLLVPVKMSGSRSSSNPDPKFYPDQGEPLQGCIQLHSPQSRRNVIGDDAIDGVVAATPQEERDPEHSGHPNRPMEEEELPTGVWNEQKNMFTRYRNITECVTQPHNASKYYQKNLRVSFRLSEKSILD